MSITGIIATEPEIGVKDNHRGSNRTISVRFDPKRSG